ncbi:MAG TPA: NAD(P)-dependent oxidoreductase [Polyangia bacterium]
MRILFTGATSLAGRRLCARLGAHGHEVVAVSRQPLAGPGASVQVDLEADDAAARLPDGPFDALVHFASFVPQDERASRWEECYARNVVPAARLLEWAAGRVRRVLLASSCAVYGAAKLATPTTEEHPLRPDTAYALSKYAQEQLFAAFCRTQGVPLVTLRLGYVVGPGMPAARAVVAFIDMVRAGRPITLANPHSAGLHLVHQDDIAAIGEALLTEGEGAYNLASPRHISLFEYVETVMQVLDRRVEITVREDRGAPVTNHYCCRRLLERHGLAPRVTLADAIRSLADAREVTP